MSSYQQRVSAERLAAQAPAVQKTAKAILDELKSLENYLHWALNPEDKDGRRYWLASLIEHAHMLVDLGHAYRAALAADPPPKEDDESHSE